MRATSTTSRSFTRIITSMAGSGSLPWHRVYMYEFEQAIQDQCPDVTLPYWDWVAPQYPTNPIPNALQAFLTKPALDALGSGDPQLSPEEIQTLWENLNGKLFPTLSGFLDAVADRKSTRLNSSHLVISYA